VSRHCTHRARGASNRRTRRVVRTSAGSCYDPRLLDVTAAHGYLAGLRVLRWLSNLYPAFYAEHIASRVITPALLGGSVLALYGLTERRVPLYWPMEFHSECHRLQGEHAMMMEPEELLRRYEGRDSQPNGWTVFAELEDMDYHWLTQPTPQLYGIGLDVMLSGEVEVTEDVLTHALWWLFRNTQWGLAMQPDDLLEAVGYTSDHPVGAVIRSLEPLPDTTPVRDLYRSLHALPGLLSKDEFSRFLQPPEDLEWAWPGDVLAYPFSQTSTQFANTSNEELVYVYQGQHDIDWKDLLDMESIFTYARHGICGMYTLWSAWVDANPAERLPEIATYLRDVAAELPQLDSPEKAKTLIEIMSAQDFRDGRRPGDGDDEEDFDLDALIDEDELVAWNE